MSALTEEILPAARFAQNTRLRVRVVIDRAPGAAAQIRDAARAADTEVSVELTPTSAVGYFGTGRRASRAQPLLRAERDGDVPLARSRG